MFTPSVQQLYYIMVSVLSFQFLQPILFYFVEIFGMNDLLDLCADIPLSYCVVVQVYILQCRLCSRKSNNEDCAGNNDVDLLLTLSVIFRLYAFHVFDLIEELHSFLGGVDAL